MATCTPACRPSSTAARRCVSRACTPPVPINPMMCNVPSCRRVSATSCTRAGIRKNSPTSIDCDMRTISCGTTRPAPRFRCPTSLLPICPSGRPTARSDASSSVRDAPSHSLCHTGVRPSSMALLSRPGRKPHPSSTTRTTGVCVLRLVVILKGMQVSQITPVLLAVLSLATSRARPVASQGGGRYRVSVDNAWFYQDVAGRRIARLARGAILPSGATRNDWMQVLLEGWIFSTSVGPSDRPDFDLLVTRSPSENLRAAPAGPLVAELSQGFGLKRAPPDSSGRWVHVTRIGWVQRSALHPADTRDMHPPAAAVGRRALESESLRQLGDQRSRRRGAEVFAGRAGDQQVEVGPIARADGRGEDPAFEQDLHPVVASCAARQDGATRESRDATARDVLIEPGIVDADAIPAAALGRHGTSPRR